MGASLFHAGAAAAAGESLKPVILVLAAALVLAPAFATLPTVDACQPYTYYCVIDGDYHHACGTKIPSSCVMSVLDYLP